MGGIQVRGTAALHRRDVPKAPALLLWATLRPGQSCTTQSRPGQFATIHTWPLPP